MTSAVTEERIRVLRLSNLPTLAGPIMPLPAVRVSPLLQKPQAKEPECSTALVINVERLLFQADVSYLSSSLKLFTHLSPGTTFRQAVFNKQRGRYDINPLRPLRKSNPPRIQGETAGKDQNNISFVNDDPGKLSKAIHWSQSICVVSRGSVACNKSEKHLLDDFKHSLQVFLGQCHLSINGPLVADNLRKLFDEVKVISSLGILRYVRSTDVVQLLHIIRDLVKSSGTFQIVAAEHSGNPKINEIMSILDAISLAMHFLTSSGMSREIYREDLIEELINAIKYLLVYNLFSLSSDSEKSHKARKPTSFQLGTTHEGFDGKSVSTKSTCAAESWVEEVGVILKQRRQAKASAILVNSLATILRQLANLLIITQLSSSHVYQVTNLCMISFSIDGIDLIHPNAAEVVVSAFKNYPEHRSFILDDMLATLLKMPSSSRRFRRLLLPEDDCISVHVMTAVLVRCIEYSVTFHPNLKSEAEIDMANLPDSETGCGPAFRWSHYFWKEFLSTWHSAKVQEVDFKGQLSNIVSDLLAVLNLPEWPAAGIVLLSLSAQLLSCRGIGCPEIKIREFALDILGQIAAKVRVDGVACERDNLLQSLTNAKMSGEQGTEVSKSTSDALELACQDACFLRITSCSSHVQHSQNIFADPDMLVFECMHLWNICKVAMREAISHRMEFMSLAFSLAQLTRESERCELGFRSGFGRPGGDSMVYRTLYDFYESRVINDPSTATSGTKLSRPIAIRLCRILQQRFPLARQSDLLFCRIIGALEDSAISVRAAAVRALASVMDADPQLLTSDRMRLILTRRLSDNGTMVRATIVDILGKHVVRDAGVASIYIDSIVERLSDVGVSVRRRAVHVLREYLCSSDVPGENIRILGRLAFRIFDDDSSIQELVIGIFRDVWLQFDEEEQTPNQKSVRTFSKSAAQCASSFVEVVWKTYCSVSRTGLARLPLLPSFPIIGILRRVICTQVSQNIWCGQNVDGIDQHNDNVRMIDRAQQLCRAVLNLFLHHEEQTVCRSFALGGVEMCSKDTEDDESRQRGIGMFPMAVRYALGVHVICGTDRRLCVPTNNPMEFAVALHPYLKMAENNPINSIQLQCCISVVDAVIAESTITRCFATEIEKDLRVLLLRSTYHGVLYHASRCLCTIARKLPESSVSSGVLQISRRFANFLGGVHEKYDTSQESTAHISRALFVLGNLSRYGADVLQTSHEEGISLVSLMRLFQNFLEHTGRYGFGIKRRALQACGYIFISRPHMLLSSNRNSDYQSFDGIMHAALDVSAERGIKEQALLIIDEYLHGEEEKSLKRIASAPCTVPHIYDIKRPDSQTLSAGEIQHINMVKCLEYSSAEGLRDFQMVNGEHESNLPNALAQRYWPGILALCIDFEPSVRLKALHLTEIILRQGLVHPMSSFPSLIALQVDPLVTVRKLAFQLLKRQYKKHPTFFDNQICAGVELMFVFCKRLHSGARRAQSWDKTVNSTNEIQAQKLVSADDIDYGIQNIYKLVNQTRAARFKFIMSLLRRFEDSNSAAHIPYVCFLANIIATMPFSTHDEVLFTAYHLNRIVLLRASSLPDSLQRHIASSSDQMTMRTSAEANDPVMGQDTELVTIMTITRTLQLHIKHAYDLTDSRLRAYSPSEPLKSGEGIRLKDRLEPLDLSWVDLDAFANREGRVRQANLLFSFIRDG